MNSSVAFRVLTQSRDHHHCLILDHFSRPAHRPLSAGSLPGAWHTVGRALHGPRHRLLSRSTASPGLPVLWRVSARHSLSRLTTPAMCVPRFVYPWTFVLSLSAAVTNIVVDTHILVSVPISVHLDVHLGG